MATDLTNEFNEQYTNITNKLKKRFMRKPNLSEAKNELIALAIQCEHAEQPAFAGQCYVTATKCDSALGDFLGESELYLAAARQFMKAEMQLSSLKAYSPARENLEASINCYIQASNKYLDKSSIRTSILLELAQNLHTLEHTKEATYYYEQALDLLGPDNCVAVQCMCKLVSLYFKNEQYDFSLDMANRICDMEKRYVTNNILSEQQVNRILLSILVEPSESNIKPSFKKLIEDLKDDTSNSEIEQIFNENLLIQLKSILIACESKDIESLIMTLPKVKEHFTMLQHEAYMKIIEIYRSKY